MSYIDTRDLIEERDNLKEQILDDFNDRFNTELDDFDEIETYLNDEASENIDEDERDDEDYVTLVTCTPYSVNTHRLLVRGKRTDYKEAIKKTPNEVNNGIHIPYEVKLAFLSFIIIGIIIFIWRRR